MEFGGEIYRGWVCICVSIGTKRAVDKRYNNVVEQGGAEAVVQTHPSLRVVDRVCWVMGIRCNGCVFYTTNGNGTVKSGGKLLSVPLSVPETYSLVTPLLTTNYSLSCLFLGQWDSGTVKKGSSCCCAFRKKKV